MNAERLSVPSPVSVSGGYWTGSSAVVDILQEHKQCSVVPGEFTLFSHGLFFEELYSLPGSDRENQRKFLNNLLRMKEFNRPERGRPSRAVRRLLSILDVHPKWLYFLRVGMAKQLGNQYQSACDDLLTVFDKLKDDLSKVDIDEVSGIVKRIIGSVIETVSGQGLVDSRVGILDQLIVPPYISSASKCIPTLKYINVDRDWRDQYVFVRDRLPKMLKVHRSLGVKPWGESRGIQRLGGIDFFVSLRRKIEQVKQEQKTMDNVLWLQFEDIVFDTETTAEKIFNFLGIDKECWLPGKHFVAELSRKNVNVWKHAKYMGEIAMIEAKLG